MTVVFGTGYDVSIKMALEHATYSRTIEWLPQRFIVSTVVIPNLIGDP